MSWCGYDRRFAAGAFDPRQEPGAVVPLAGIRAGGGGQPPSLPRQRFAELARGDLEMRLPRMPRLASQCPGG
jgi:hypothetical protein